VSFWAYENRVPLKRVQNLSRGRHLTLSFPLQYRRGRLRDVDFHRHERSSPVTTGPKRAGRSHPLVANGTVIVASMSKLTIHGLLR